MMRLDRQFAILAFGLLALAGIGSAATETYYFFVFSNPTPSHEDEYNKCYNEQHAQDVVAVPGFVTAQRFVKNDLPLYRMVDLQVPKYLIVYKIVTDDVEAVFKEVNRRLDSGETVISPTFDRKTSVSYDITDGLNYNNRPQAVIRRWLGRLSKPLPGGRGSAGPLDNAPDGTGRDRAVSEWRECLEAKHPILSRDGVPSGPEQSRYGRITGSRG